MGECGWIEAVLSIAYGLRWRPRSQGARDGGDGVIETGVVWRHDHRRWWMSQRHSTQNTHQGCSLGFDSWQQIEDLALEREGLSRVDGERCHERHLVFLEERGEGGVVSQQEGSEMGEGVAPDEEIGDCGSPHVLIGRRLERDQFELAAVDPAF